MAFGFRLLDRPTDSLQFVNPFVFFMSGYQALAKRAEGRGDEGDGDDDDDDDDVISIGPSNTLENNYRYIDNIFSSQPGEPFFHVPRCRAAVKQMVGIYHTQHEKDQRALTDLKHAYNLQFEKDFAELRARCERAEKDAVEFRNLAAEFRSQAADLRTKLESTEQELVQLKIIVKYLETQNKSLELRNDELFARVKKLEERMDTDDD